MKRYDRLGYKALMMPPPREATIQYALYNMDYGKPRRTRLMELFADGIDELPVNRRYCLQINTDPDLLYLLRKGLIKRIRKGHYTHSRTTYLVINKETSCNK